MSVLIKGIDMPRSCAECRFLEGEAMDGLCHASEKWLDDDDYFLWYQYPEGDIDDSKPANCPLIEIPPHGRLIDIDAGEIRFNMGDTFFYDSPEMRLIMDARDPKEAKRIFKFTDEELLFSENGIDGPFKKCESYEVETNPVITRVTVRTKHLTPSMFALQMWGIKVDQKKTPEEKHICADNMICELLNDLGYGEGVRHFEDMEKWYS